MKTHSRHLGICQGWVGQRRHGYIGDLDRCLANGRSRDILVCDPTLGNPLIFEDSLALSPPKPYNEASCECRAHGLQSPDYRNALTNPKIFTALLWIYPTPRVHLYKLRLFPWQPVTIYQAECQSTFNVYQLPGGRKVENPKTAGSTINSKKKRQRFPLRALCFVELIGVDARISTSSKRKSVPSLACSGLGR